MASPPQQPRVGDRGEEADREGIIAELLAKLGLGQEAPPQQGPGVINGVDVNRLIEYVFGDTARPATSLRDMEAVKALLERVNALTRELVDVYTRDGLSRVYHPVYGGGVLDARLMELTMLLKHAVREAWEEVKERIRGNAPPEEVAEAAARAEMLTRFSYLVAVEAYAKLLTVYMANAPARARPPLVNVSLGYDILE